MWLRDCSSVSSMCGCQNFQSGHCHTVRGDSGPAGGLLVQWRWSVHTLTASSVLALSCVALLLVCYCCRCWCLALSAIAAIVHSAVSAVWLVLVWAVAMAEALKC